VETTYWDYRITLAANYQFFFPEKSDLELDFNWTIGIFFSNKNTQEELIRESIF